MILMLFLSVTLASYVAYLVMHAKMHIPVLASFSNELTQQKIKVTGNVPLWLEGYLIRNGPINIEINGKSPHWIDGPAMLHTFAFKQGSIIYTNKFLRTDAYTQIFKKSSLEYVGFTTKGPHPLWQKTTSFLTAKNKQPLHNANVNVARIANEYVALTETPLPVSFDPQTLETLGTLYYDDNLAHGECFESAHPHYDVERKETINYMITFGPTCEYIVYRIKDGSSSREMIAQIPVSEPSYMHSFAVTENYIILPEIPFQLKPLELILQGKPFIRNFHWHPDRQTHFTVISKASGEAVKRYTTKPFFTFHNVNAFEYNGNIVCDIICYENPQLIDDLENYTRTPGGTSLPASRFERFTLPLKAEQLSSEILIKRSVEFPRINNAFDGRPYQYTYTIDTRDITNANDIRPLFKINTLKRLITLWEEEGCYPGEPVFVPAPQAKAEDDGVILTVVADYKHKGSYLLILDAKTFKELARAQVPHPIPPGLHGDYFTAA